MRCQVDGKDAQSATDKGDLGHGGEEQSSMEYGRGLDDHIHLTIHRRGVQRRLLWRGWLQTGLTFFQKSLKIPT